VRVLLVVVSISIFLAIALRPIPDAHAQSIGLTDALVVDFGAGSPVQVGDELQPAGALFKVDLPSISFH